MNQNRPVNLDVTKYRFPVTAIVSILHRASGFFVFLLLPLLLWMLDYSLNSSIHFNQLKADLASPALRVLVWLLLSALLYHLIAGIRHLLMDMGFGESKNAGKVGAYVVLVIAVIVSILAGAWLW